MKTSRLPDWAQSVHQCMFDAGVLEAAIATKLKELGYGG